MNLDWLAGFFDGEGSVSCALSGNQTYVRVSITQKLKEPLLEIFDAFPEGSLYSTEKVTISGKKNGVWVLFYQGSSCVKILASLHGRVKVKKVQVEAGLYLSALIDPADAGRVIDKESSKLRYELAEVITKANHKEWVPPDAKPVA
jgi:hypothetical protein